MIAKLARVEWLKTKHRFAFWIASLSFVALVLIGLGADYYRNSRATTYNYQPVWPSAMGSAEGFGLLIMMVLIVLLTASEKTWRTERQNVIDGLSRTHYFLGKLLLVVACTIAFWISVALLATVFEWLNRGLVTTVIETPFIGRTHMLQFLSVLLYLFFIGSVAFLFGTISSSSGAALALAFLSLMLQPPIMLLMAREGGGLHEATAYLPMQVLQSLGSANAWDAERLAEINSRMRGSGLPLMLGAGAAAAMTALYSMLACLLALWSIRRRDL